MPQSQNWLIIAATFFVSLILMLLPMPDWAVWFRPAWVVMTLIYWVMAVPHRVNVGAAWVVGIMVDVLTGTLLGEHALALTIVAYLVAKMYPRMRMFPLLQQGLSIFFLILLYQFVLYCVQGFIGQLPPTRLYWSASVTSMLLWPWVFSIIRNCRRHFKVVPTGME